MVITECLTQSDKTDLIDVKYSSISNVAAEGYTGKVALSLHNNLLIPGLDHEFFLFQKCAVN